MSVLLTQYENGIAVVRLNRPRKLNAIDYDTLTELDRVFKEDLTQGLSRIKVVVLTGTEDQKAFTSGLDLSCPRVRDIIFRSPDSKETNVAERSVELKTIIDCMQSPIMTIAKYPRPVICAISGICFGLGVDLASACDIRIASETAKISVREIKIGICADLGSLFFLPRICRNDSWVREVCMTGRIFSAQEAFNVGGFVSEVIPSNEFEKRTLEIARSIAENPSVALHGIKVNLDMSLRHRMNECFDYVSVWNSVKIQDTNTITECVSKLFESKL